MTRKYIHVLALAAMMTGFTACQDEIVPDLKPETEVCEEEYVPDYRNVQLTLEGMGDFIETKGDIMMQGQACSTWNSGESKINTWKIGVYDASGMLFSTEEGNGTPSSLMIKTPLNQNATVVAVANVQEFVIPRTLAEWRSYVFHFNKESLVSDGVPASAETGLTENETYAYIQMKRLVSKINFKLVNPAFRSFTATEVSLHNVAMDSRSGSSVGYVEKDFDYATSAELAAINAGTTQSDSYVVSFICPENLKGTVSSITRPSDKVPANAPADATYLEVKGHVESSGYGSGDITYRFYLGKNATSDFNLERNYVYNVTLNINAGNLGNYQDDYTWKVDVGDFDFASYDYWWIDPETGWKGKSKVIMQGESALLVVRVPKDLEHDESTVYAYICLGNSEQYEDGRWAPEYVGRNKAELDESCAGYTDGGLQLGGPGDPFNGYLRSEELGDIYYNVNSEDDLSSIGDSYVEVSNRMWGYDYSESPMVLEELGCEGGLITDRNGNGILGNFAASDGDFANWFVFRVYANTVENLREGYDYGDAACLSLYDDGSYETYSVPIYVSESPSPQIDINKSGQYAYVGQMLQMTGRYFTSAPDWTVTSGSAYVGLNTANGTQVSSQNAVNLVCKAEGKATIRCKRGTQERVFEVEVRKPVLHSRFEQLREGYPIVGGEVDNEYLLIDGNDYGLYLDGGVQTNLAWWYIGVEGQKLTFSDESVFRTYVNARYAASSSFNYVEDHPAGNYGASNGIYLTGINALPNSSRTHKGLDLGYYFTLADNLGSTGPVNDYYNTPGIPVDILNPLYQVKEEVGLTNAMYMTGMTDGGRTTEIEKNRFCNVNAFSSPAAYNSQVTVELFPGEFSGSESLYRVTPSGSVVLVSEAGNPYGYECYAGLKVTNSRDGSVWRSWTENRSVVECFIIVGICQRLGREYIAKMSGAAYTEVSFFPCVYSPNNTSNVYTILSLPSKLGYCFSWKRDNQFLTDNLKYWDRFVIGWGWFLDGWFIFMEGKTWAWENVRRHADMDIRNQIPYVRVDRCGSDEKPSPSDDVWSWSLPTLGPWDLCTGGSQHVLNNMPGITLAEPFDDTYQNPMVTSDPALFELYANPSANGSGGNFYQMSDGAICFKDPNNKNQNFVFVNLGTTTTYRAVINNSYSSAY